MNPTLQEAAQWHREHAKWIREQIEAKPDVLGREAMEEEAADHDRFAVAISEADEQ